MQILEFLSNIELYFTNTENVTSNNIIVEGEECRHISKVMRHSSGEKLFITNGLGKIFQTKIISVGSDLINTVIEKIFEYENPLSNVFFCIPKIKSPDRFEFILEKCSELGVTNFVIYNAERAIALSERIERWNKVLLAAMKQSLRSYLPKIYIENSLKEISSNYGIKYVFEQESENKFSGLINLDNSQNIYFIFGPEGGLSKNEFSLFSKEEIYKIADNRLRTETAVIKCASLLL